MKSFEAGAKVSQGHYKSFQSNPVNRDLQLDDMQLLNHLSKADRLLGRPDMYSEYVNIELFIRMYIAKETTQSSKIGLITEKSRATNYKLLDDLGKMDILKRNNRCTTQYAVCFQ